MLLLIFFPLLWYTCLSNGNDTIHLTTPNKRWFNDAISGSWLPDLAAYDVFEIQDTKRHFE